MRCPKCNYFFSEEVEVCPKCGRDMRDVIEKLGFFPKPGNTPILTPEEFFKGHTPPQKSEATSSPKEIELNLSEE